MWKPHLVFLVHVSVLQLKLLCFKLAHPLPEFVCGFSAWKPIWEHDKPVHECETTACGFMSQCMLNILHYISCWRRFLTCFLPQLVCAEVFDVQFLTAFTQDRFFLLSLGLLLRPTPFVCLSIKNKQAVSICDVLCDLWPLSGFTLCMYPVYWKLARTFFFLASSSAFLLASSSSFRAFSSWKKQKWITISDCFFL